MSAGGRPLLWGPGVAVGGAAVVLGLAGLAGGGGTVELAWLVPLGGLRLTLDPLAGLFLALIGGLTVPASLYATAYAPEERGSALAYHLFVVSMCLVPLAGNVMTFAIAWELMALASYFLVVHRRDASSVRAAWVYAVMTHAGLACLLAGMLIMAAATGSLTFADWRAAGPALSPAARVAVLILLGLGFAGKAGVIPLHVWLPLAHPAAPSHVSALMSGAMIKLGIYGLLRLGLDWLGPAPAWLGLAILVVGTVSSVVGVLYALVDHDLKRLLAFHSIENVGIILIGLGAGMVFRDAGLDALAVLGVTAALYHTVNHGVFKALLFLGAGAVVHATGTRNMEAMGGLVKRMPWTAACFLVGSVAIAALPPLNGFVSEWLTFQALLQTVRLDAPGVSLVFTAGIAGLALTGGLAAACFVKAFGISFLALPRSAAAATAHEAPVAMRAAMVFLATLCVGLGLGATVVTPALGGVAGSLLGAQAPLGIGPWLTLEVSGDFASLSMPVLALGLAVAVAAVAAALALGGPRQRRIGETWGCGRILQTARMEYTATAFASPFKRVFDFFYRPVKRLSIEAHPASRLFVTRIEYENPTRALFEEWLYRPALAGLRRATHAARRVQSGSPNVYLAYILAALLVMLVLA